MYLLHTVLYALLGTAFVFAVIELGLSAYTQSLFESASRYSYYTAAPPVVGLLIFASILTMLVTGSALFVPWFFASRGPLSRSFKTIMSIVHVGTYFVTMVFWLAGFADLANIMGPNVGMSRHADAMLAFAILLWLIFIALFVLNILTVCGILKSDWPGYTPFKDRFDNNVGPATGENAPVEASGEMRYEGNPVAHA